VRELSAIKKQNSEFIEILKSNYKKRIEEVDNFSKNFSSSSANFRSQYLAGLSDLLQYYLELQKKFTKGYPVWYDVDLMSKQSRLITEVWINTIHSMNSLYSTLLDFGTKNNRIFNQGMIQAMQMAEMYYNTSEIPIIQKSKLIEIIKQAKKSNDNMQKQITKKRISSNNEIHKKQVIAKEIS
jgi:hypothetical protein